MRIENTNRYSGWAGENVSHISGSRTLVVCVLLFLSGCASMSEQECLVADWRLLGYEDAMAGRSAATIAQHRRACAGVGVIPDLDLYQYGHEEGARQYCTVANGYRAGTNGTEYQGICPADLEYPFMEAYRDGRGLYVINEEISSLQSDVRKYEAEVTRLRHEIDKLEKAIVDSDSSPEARRATLTEIATLGETIADREVDIAQAQRSIAQLELEHYYMVEDHRLLGY